MLSLNQKASEDFNQVYKGIRLPMPNHKDFSWNHNLLVTGFKNVQAIQVTPSFI